jgi:hypothetical protein
MTTEPDLAAPRPASPPEPDSAAGQPDPQRDATPLATSALFAAIVPKFPPYTGD